MRVVWSNLRMRKTLLVLAVSLISACAQSAGMAPADMPPSPPPPDMDIPLSSCGHPGDTGNSLGVGKFCTQISDCLGPGLSTNICSSLGNGGTPSPGDTYFCTIYPCQLDGGTNVCGTNATCTCGSGGGGSGCACTPNSCLGNPPTPDMATAIVDGGVRG
jgi:hypothetical protein